MNNGPAMECTFAGWIRNGLKVVCLWAYYVASGRWEALEEDCESLM